MLTAKKVERSKKPGRYRCGLVKGLLLQVTDTGARSWVLRYELRGREHWMGLGSASEFSLKEARERARQARQLLADRIDPLAGKRAAEEAQRLQEARRISFAEAAQQYFDQHEKRWRNAGHREEFLRSLRDYAFPVLGKTDVTSIDTPDVLRALEGIWKTKPVTADRTRARIEQVIDWCIVRGHRPPGTNPARWKGHLDQVLPPPRQLAPIVHHKAIHYRDVPAFMAQLRQQDGVAARALEFLILCTVRTNECIGAQWSEINFDSKAWVIPASRMKTGREFKIPLSPAALDLLRKLPRQGGEGLVFVARQSRKALNKMELPRVMDRLGQKGVTTVHGFRSSFRDWAGETTAFAHDICEAALAHSRGSAVVTAYARGDLYLKRVKLMEAWAKYCMMPPAKVGKAGGDVVNLRGGR